MNELATSSVQESPSFKLGFKTERIFLQFGNEELRRLGPQLGISTYKLPRSRWKNCRMVAAFASRIDSIASYRWNRTAAEIVAWLTSSLIYLPSFTRVLFPVGVDANDQNRL